MARDKSTFFVQLLLVIGGLVLIDAQFDDYRVAPAYGRSRFLRPRLRHRPYPRYPEPYRPVVGGGPVVSDGSHTASHTVVTNNNVNTDIRRDSGNVHVNQGQDARTTGRGRGTGMGGCHSACRYDYECGFGMECEPTGSCYQCVRHRPIWH